MNSINIDLQSHLKEKVSNFKQLSEKQQRNLLHLMHAGLVSNRYAHKQDSSCFYCPYEELDKMFGKTKFKSLMKTLDPVLIEEHIKPKVGSHTYGFRITAEAKALFLEYYRQASQKAPEYADAQTGKPLRIHDTAIASKNQKGSKAKAVFNIPTWQPINVSKLIKLRDTLVDHHDKAESGNYIDELTAIYGVDYKDRIIRQLIQTCELIQLSKNKKHPGHIPLRYAEAQSGRLYGSGLHLQNVCKEVRNAALHGLYDYDIENCHFALIEQLASKQGLECKAIKAYIKHKTVFRNTLATDIGISINDVKKCLLAIVYGATKSLRRYNAIPAEIGVDKAKLLFEHKSFNSLYDDIIKARKVIISKCERHKDGYINAMGKSISADKPGNKVLSHILQGLESKILNIVGQIYKRDLVLLVHDGWVTNIEIDKEKVIKEAYQQTGIKIEISEDRIASIRATTEDKHEYKEAA